MEITIKVRYYLVLMMLTYDIIVGIFISLRCHQSICVSEILYFKSGNDLSKSVVDDIYEISLSSIKN